MIVDFFCGIGGFAAAIEGEHALPQVFGPGGKRLAIDINRRALTVHRMNFGETPDGYGHSGKRSWQTVCKTIESLTADELRQLGVADDDEPAFWWMSPPCQPHTRQGLRRDLDDSRSAGFRNVVRLIEQMRPQGIGLENVPEFDGSASHELLGDVLERCGYSVQCARLCATRFGSPNRRPRFWMVASTSGEVSIAEPVANTVERRLETVDDRSTLELDTLTRERYASAIHVVEAAEFLGSRAETRCFTAAYGRSPLRSGSYLRDLAGLRRFTPREVLWQLGFPRGFQLPDWPPRQLWPLTGNSLSVSVVRHVLGTAAASRSPAARLQFSEHSRG